MKKKMIKVSVIMGVYNPDENRLLNAVESIIGQTMREWELFLYDDGSSTEGAEIIRRIAARDPRIIHVRKEENRGLAYALNWCVRQAKGKYIARMDDDDWSQPERFQIQSSFLDRCGEYEWVGSNAALFDADGIWGEMKMPERPEKKDFLRYSPYIHPSVMFRRDVFRRNYGYISCGITKRCEDYELFMRLHTRGEQGYNIQAQLILYREDKAAYAKRSHTYRINEIRIRYRGFKRLGILKPSTLAYVFRPIAGEIIPVSRMAYMLRRNKDGSLSNYENSQTSTIHTIFKKNRSVLPPGRHTG